MGKWGEPLFWGGREGGGGCQRPTMAVARSVAWVPGIKVGNQPRHGVGVPRSPHTTWALGLSLSSQGGQGQVSWFIHTWCDVNVLRYTGVSHSSAREGGKGELAVTCGKQKPEGFQAHTKAAGLT